MQSLLLQNRRWDGGSRQIDPEVFPLGSTGWMSFIPMRCFTCGEPLASKYVAYVNKVQEEKAHGGCAKQQATQYLTDTKDLTPSVEAKTLDSLELYKMCCRRHMLTHVDIY